MTDYNYYGRSDETYADDPDPFVCACGEELAGYAIFDDYDGQSVLHVGDEAAPTIFAASMDDAREWAAGMEFADHDVLTPDGKLAVEGACRDALAHAGTPDDPGEGLPF